MDKAIMFGILAFAATLLVAGGTAREIGKEKGFECPMQEAMEKAGYAGMEQMHAAMHGNMTGCPIFEAMERSGYNFTGNFTDMNKMHEAMHGNSTEGCPMMQGIGPGPIPPGGMMPPGPGGMMGMMQRGR